ncbi:thiamine pyrophosphate-dependent enzyme [Paraburkholderia sp. MMS20-SJTN17]|uniref:Thiamine pyrophosphate-dependent enzyme n=1 Tax=Paraburkholderia translucens TaxID=2886945 RepID=A0ABS8KEZ7_9BURK|nr:thiamine pyrophosphate-dependent enzyme [Paraburkholderia sp. MMS20-SJTN17]MCC8403354.1 thiamine pyrophosphate-dependent enzyme [Paraburkholderia sp. MMS20-SJTN17]
MKASDLFVMALENEGVERIFAVRGEENLDVLESLRHSAIELIVTRHEQSAAFMAATHGRLTGKPGVCMATLGPGALNLVTGAAYAHLGAMPMVLITGQKAIMTARQARFQIVDIVATMKPLTKASRQIVNGASIPTVVRDAFRVASEERPGPVHLELPEDVAASEVFFPHAEVVGDLGLSLARLADLVEGKLPYAAAMAPLREGILMRTLERANESRFPLTPQRIVHDVWKIMPADGIVALDNGMYKLWFARCYRTRSANTLLLDNALATMGAGLPSAMMAAILYPDRRVMAVCGDGGFMMNSQELETAVRLKLNLVVLIIQDDAYGMIRWKQAVDSFADWGLTFGNPDFVKYADAYGAKGRRIETAEALAPTLESAFREGGVQLVIVPVDYSENVRVFVEELGNRVMEVAQ